LVADVHNVVAFGHSKRGVGMAQIVKADSTGRHFLQSTID
jgi:hypothetical protein